MAQDICRTIFEELPKLPKKTCRQVRYHPCIFVLKPTHFKAGVDPKKNPPGTIFLLQQKKQPVLYILGGFLNYWHIHIPMDPKTVVQKWPVSRHLKASHSCRTIWPLPGFFATSRQIQLKKWWRKKRCMNIHTCIHIHIVYEYILIYSSADSKQKSSNPTSSFAVLFLSKKLSVKLFWAPGTIPVASTSSKRRKILIPKKQYISIDHP